MDKRNADKMTASDEHALNVALAKLTSEFGAQQVQDALTRITQED